MKQSLPAVKNLVKLQKKAEKSSRGADLEDGIIKTKQNVIRDNFTKRNLIDGGRTFQLNVRQTYKAS
ncbi:hypothetical protein OYG12_10885, partial [Actinobacillus pleuropneumoniae]|nr:hypothetical protein [Actinobacillus pleuropneumoniae]